MALLEVVDLHVCFETDAGVVRAVDGISFTLERGETLGVVGESGSGKSLSNLALLGLVPRPGIVSAQRIVFDGCDLSRARASELRKIRGKEISMIFQDPMTSLNPLMSVGRQLCEVLEVHEGLSTREARKRAAAGLAEVGMAEPERRLDSYPHELSGGMRQRVMIAMALLCRPRILIADEPTTALDVTIQAQILELIRDLQERHGMSILLVSHSLGVIAGSTERVQVMYAGRIVEAATTQALFERPLHPYTRGLLDSVPRIDRADSGPLHAIPGQPPDLSELAPGCAFAPRCALVFERCRSERPPLERVAGTARLSACHLAQQLAAQRDSQAATGQEPR